jgi:hypothetical protein
METNSPRKTLTERGYGNRVYAAEDAARKACPVELLDGTEKAAQIYVDRITRSSWWARTCPPSWMGDPAWQKEGKQFLVSPQPPKRVWVFAKRGHGAHANVGTVRRKPGYRDRAPHIHLGSSEIVLAHAPDWAVPMKQPWVILHELAHIMATCHNHAHSTTENGHGRIFAYYYMLLVRRWLGADAARALREAYAVERVKYRLPRLQK